MKWGEYDPGDCMVQMIGIDRSLPWQSYLQNEVKSKTECKFICLSNFCLFPPFYFRKHLQEQRKTNFNVSKQSKSADKQSN